MSRPAHGLRGSSRTTAGSGLAGAGATLRGEVGDITSEAGRVWRGVAHVGVSVFDAITVVFSVIFLTLFRLIDEARLSA